METNKLSFTLIEGEFGIEEAREILLGLITHKILHHEMQAFSHQVRFNKEYPNQDRVKKLEETRKLIKEFFDNEEPEHIISIFSEISITKKA